MTEEPLRVEVTRSGGITGAVRCAVADSGELDVAAAAELARLVEECSFSDLDAAPAAAPDDAVLAPDRFQYDVTLHRGGQVTSFVRREPELTPADQRLLRWVLSRA